MTFRPGLLLCALLPLAAVAQESGPPEQVAAGVTYQERRFMRGADGPFVMQVLEVNPRDPRVNLLPVRAKDHMTGKETVSSMVRRYGATAGVNGGYFVVSGTYAGASAGVYQLDGQPLASGSGRTALVLCQERNFVERLEMDVIAFRGRVAAGENTANIAALNLPRGTQQIVAYLPQLGPTTLTDGTGVEVLLDGASRVTAVELAGNSAIPPDGKVLSGAGAGAQWLRAHASPGNSLDVRMELARSTPGCPAADIVGGGPRLVRGGKPAGEMEGFSHAATRNPRTAAAVTHRGTLLFVTVDGRSAASVGMRLDELADELIALGAAEAMNLDGGGSTTMVAGDRVRNTPSDGNERAVSDGILVFSTGSVEELSALVERLGMDGAQIRPDILAAMRQKLRDGAVRDLLPLVNGEGVSAPAARLLREAAYAVAKRGCESRADYEREPNRNCRDGGQTRPRR
ncbi:MAG TPA: phosphodiester glycosidase family protein [Bryobacteraceae bacterium]|nr:phosphodiester glycosidase family protein [Bryobacteraceae bacterium]